MSPNTHPTYLLSITTILLLLLLLLSQSIQAFPKPSFSSQLPSPPPRVSTAPSLVPIPTPSPHIFLGFNHNFNPHANKKATSADGAADPVRNLHRSHRSSSTKLKNTPTVRTKSKGINTRTKSKSRKRSNKSKSKRGLNSKSKGKNKFKPTSRPLVRVEGGQPGAQDDLQKFTAESAPRKKNVKARKEKGANKSTKSKEGKSAGRKQKKATQNKRKVKRGSKSASSQGVNDATKTKRIKKHTDENQSNQGDIYAGGDSHGSGSAKSTEYCRCRKRDEPVGKCYYNLDTRDMSCDERDCDQKYDCVGNNGVALGVIMCMKKTTTQRIVRNPKPGMENFCIREYTEELLVVPYYGPIPTEE